MIFIAKLTIYLRRSLRSVTTFLFMFILPSITSKKGNVIYILRTLQCYSIYTSFPYIYSAEISFLSTANNGNSIVGTQAM